MERIVFAETGTLGIRRHDVTRTKLQRREESVDTRFGPIRMKVSGRGEVAVAAAEFEDCRAAALQHDVPLREVMAAARAAWESIQGGQD